MESHIGNIMTLSNSIIGVSILAMPFCFKQCGIILAILMLLISSIITRLTCHFLLKSAIMARRRTFELLAFHAFGTAGKFMVELGIIGFLMGTCIAFFVIIGDLGPAIIAKILGSKPTDTLRTSILVGVALFCVLPLGLLKNVDSLHSVSIATIGFYFCLVLKTVSESTAHFISGDWYSKVELWRPAGVLQCLPIFAMALSCQTQLFEIYDTVTNPTLDKMNYIVRNAINICVAVYVCVGFFGYSAFATQPFTGNILMTFSPSSVTDVMKIGFVLSVAFSFPLVIFPCRASLYSLLFKKGYNPYEGSNNYIPEAKFKFLTVLIIVASLIIGILIPNIEVVLGLLGSTIGTMICLIFPVTCFICISTKNTNERLIAQILLFVGVIVMVLGTYANLYAMEQINDPIPIEKVSILDNMKNIESEKIFQADPDTKNVQRQTIEEKPEEIRLEPPQPVEPIEEIKKNIPEEIPKEPISKVEDIPKVENTPKVAENNKNTQEENIKNEETITEPQQLQQQQPKTIDKLEKETKKAEEVDKEAIKKEETELQEEEKTKGKEEKDDEKQKEQLLETLKEHKKEQENLIKEQKELIQELKKEKQELKEKKKIEVNAEQAVRRKAASQILEIAKKAIEQLAPEAISTNPLLIDTKKENKSNDVKTDNKINKAPIITDPIAKKIIEFANNANNVQNPKKSVVNVNEVPLVPLPIALNVQKPENSHEFPENKNDTTTKSTEKIIKENNNENKEEPELLKPVVLQKENVNIDNKQNEEIVDEKQKESKNNEDNNIIKKLDNIIKTEKPAENILPARRDILSNEENTENIRAKREAKDSDNNEKCEMTEKNTEKTELPSAIALKIISKSDILKIESNNLIESMKTQLQAESLHMKRK